MLRQTRYVFIALGMLLWFSEAASEESSVDLEQLHNKIEQLEAELKQARQALAEAEELAVQQEQALAEFSDRDADIQFGPLRVGGAMRANFAIGDYPEVLLLVRWKMGAILPWIPSG